MGRKQAERERVNRKTRGEVGRKQQKKRRRESIKRTE